MNLIVLVCEDSNLVQNFTKLICEELPPSLMNCCDIVASQCSTLRLDTPYYQAEITLVHVHPNQWKTFSSSTKQALQQASVFLFMVSEGNWNDQKLIIEKIDDSDEDDTSDEFVEDSTLLILLSQENSNLNMLNEWNSERGIECIVINESEDVNWNYKSSLLDDSEGWDRVCEAILTTSWPNIDLKKKIKQPIRDEKELEEEEEDIIPTCNFEDLLPKDEFHPANMEDLNDNFDKTLNLMFAMREKASTMSDTERRNMAAAIILDVASAFDLEDDEDDL